MRTASALACVLLPSLLWAAPAAPDAAPRKIEPVVAGSASFNTAKIRHASFVSTITPDASSTAAGAPNRSNA